MSLRRIAGVSPGESNNHHEDRHMLSTLEGGCQTGIMDPALADHIQTGITSLFSELVRSYTCGDSSVKDETASSILCSVYYTLDAYAASLDNPDDIIKNLQETNIKTIYEAGIAILRSHVGQSKKLYRELADNKLNILLEAYNDTLDHALPVFFNTYNIEYAAHDTSSSIDYPLVFDDISNTGIIYVRQYLEKLQLETQFCRCFSQGNIVRVLSGYERRYGLGILDAPLNLFEILFDQSVLSILSGNECGDLAISGSRLTILNTRLSAHNAKGMRYAVIKTVDTMMRQFAVQNKNLIRYMRKYMALLTNRLENALANGNLAGMAIVQDEDLERVTDLYQDGDRMSNKQFSLLVDQILECENLSEKLNLISSNVHSLGDYIDLLDADCLYGDEYRHAFEALDEFALAILGRTVFGDELGFEKFSLSPENLERYEKFVESEWQKSYVSYLFSMSENERSKIEALLD